MFPLSSTVHVSHWSFLLPLLLFCRVVYTRWIRNRLNHFPPGPSPIPLLGNVHQLPMEYQERKFVQWRKAFGDIIFARFFQTNVIVLNSAQVAKELLEKRSANYSDRPPMVLQGEIMDFERMLTHTRYGERFRKLRKWTRDAFMDKTTLNTYKPIQLRETYTLLAGLLETPERFDELFTRFTAATITEITYGHTVTSLDDQYIHLAAQTAAETTENGTPGSMLVDFFPILKHYPLWLPGSSWKEKALEIKQLGRLMSDVPYKMVKDKMASGTARQCFVSTLLDEFYQQDSTPTPQDEEDISCAAAVLYGAGTETTANVFAAFILAMTQHPEVLKKAQEEIDRVVGPGRLPDFGDRDSLPYLDCIIREVFRWHPPVPMGIPHYSMKDDQYRHYNIPAECMMIANIWGMTRDTEYFPDPEVFCPERFEKWDRSGSHIMDPHNLVFGFGRRQCPAQNFAESNVYLVLAHIIATMDITKAVGAKGIPITPEHKYKSGFVHSHHLPFQCTIRPRSAEVADLIRQLASGET
ncbi:cytochrome P450 [Panus rudis PR-1116 ss-1]|nr:cytochrome P450 [Panus rudis PR-1116 ss-1]